MLLLVKTSESLAPAPEFLYISKIPLVRGILMLHKSGIYGTYTYNTGADTLMISPSLI
ncbi:hypothetical protein BARD7_02207 [Bacillus amyloliquefaciens]|nr:hypothetical protein BARD7_02207 [Bacillus amyloliquefaciens]